MIRYEVKYSPSEGISFRLEANSIKKLKRKIVNIIKIGYNKGDIITVTDSRVDGRIIWFDLYCKNTNKTKTISVIFVVHEADSFDFETFREDLANSINNMKIRINIKEIPL